MSMRYKIRFNLGRGANYKKWKVTDLETKEVLYIDPQQEQLIMFDAVLKNRRESAEKINKGHNKFICAWILCREFKYTDNVIVTENEIMYNPRIKPYWRDKDGNNIDNKTYKELNTLGNRIYF